MSNHTPTWRARSIAALFALVIALHALQAHCEDIKLAADAINLEPLWLDNDRVCINTRTGVQVISTGRAISVRHVPGSRMWQPEFVISGKAVFIDKSRATRNTEKNEDNIESVLYDYIAYDSATEKHERLFVAPEQVFLGYSEQKNTIYLYDSAKHLSRTLGVKFSLIHDRCPRIGPGSIVEHNGAVYLVCHNKVMRINGSADASSRFIAETDSMLATCGTGRDQGSFGQTIAVEGGIYRQFSCPRDTNAKLLYYSDSTGYEPIDDTQRAHVLQVAQGSGVLAYTKHFGERERRLIHLVLRNKDKQVMNRYVRDQSFSFNISPDGTKAVYVSFDPSSSKDMPFSAYLMHLN